VPTYYALKIALFIAPRVPHDVGYFICSLVGLIFWVFNRPARKAITNNITHVLGPTASRSIVNKYVRQVFVNIAKDYYDLVLLSTKRRGAMLDRLSVEGVENAERALSQGKGLIIAFVHMAGFNLAFELATVLGFPVWVVVEPLKPIKVGRLVTSLRSSPGVNIIEADSSVVRNILRVLRANGTVVLAIDRSVSNKGVEVTFCNYKTLLPAGAATLALRTGAALCPLLITRLHGNRVHLKLYEELEKPSTGDFEQDVRILTQRLADIFSQHIQRHPGQWVMARDVWSETAN